MLDNDVLNSILEKISELQKESSSINLRLSNLDFLIKVLTNKISQINNNLNAINDEKLLGLYSKNNTSDTSASNLLITNNLASDTNATKPLINGSITSDTNTEKDKNLNASDLTSEDNKKEFLFTDIEANTDFSKLLEVDESSFKDQVVPVYQRVVDETGKSLFLADVSIISPKEGVIFKSKTNGTGKWTAPIKCGAYRIVISKNKITSYQDVIVDGEKIPLSLQTIILKQSTV